jgi:hypothetical protein
MIIFEECNRFSRNGIPTLLTEFDAVTSVRTGVIIFLFTSYTVHSEDDGTKLNCSDEGRTGHRPCMLSPSNAAVFVTRSTCVL